MHEPEPDVFVLSLKRIRACFFVGAIAFLTYSVHLKSSSSSFMISFPYNVGLIPFEIFVLQRIGICDSLSFRSHSNEF